MASGQSAQLSPRKGVKLRLIGYARGTVGSRSKTNGEMRIRAAAAGSLGNSWCKTHSPCCPSSS